MSGSSTVRRGGAPAAIRAALRRRVGAFVRARREQLGLSQGDVIRALGYKSFNSVSNIEHGLEGLPAKRVYAWAEVLQVPRDAFFRFVTGESKRMEEAAGAALDPDDPAAAAEAELLATYRALPARYQRKLREKARDYAARARARPAAKPA